MVAMLGALKAGKVYVPIDPSFPPGRNTRILDDCGTRLVITNRRNLQQACSLDAGRSRVLNLDEIDPGLSDKSPDLSVSPDRLAYILYTSGSTGAPKGVAQNHRNLLHNVMKHTNGTRLCSEDRISLLASCSFAASVSDIYGALLNGATLCPFDLKEKGFQRLGEWLARQEISVYHSVPSVFTALALSLSKEQLFPCMRLIKLGGEPVTRREVELYKRHFPRSCILHIGLGATEMNIIRQYFLDHDSVVESKIVPVGYEVEDTQVLLLDEQGLEVNFGEVGEIVIRSQYLAPGIWKQPDFTASKLRPDPSGGHDRLYSTGDLGKMREGGLLECVGRKDFQVKIDGVRIELGEIEATLAEHPAIGKAVVVVEECNSETKQLVACLIASDRTPVDVSEIRQFLKPQLPEVMIPSRFIWLPEMPLTPSGKVDRLAIAELVASNNARTNIRLPRTPVEETLASIWSDLFGIHPLGVNDNFFELGGHSLLAVRLCAQIEMKFGMQVPLATLYNAPTVEQLARALRQEGKVLRWSRLAPIRSAGDRTPFFLHHGTEILAKGSGVNQPFYLLEPHGIDGRRAPRTVEEMAADYVQEIRTIQSEGPYYLGGYSLGGLVAYGTAQQLKRRGQDVKLLLLLDPAPPRQWAEVIAGERTPLVPVRSGILGDFQNRFRVGWSQLLSGPLSSRRRWLFTALKWRLAAMRARAEKDAKVSVCAISLGLGLRVPPSLRYFYFLRAGRKAARRYEAQPYPGQIVLLQAENGIGKVDHIWRSLATERLVVHELPGTHLGIIQGSESQLWADHLAACLEEAQSEKISRPERQYAGT